MKKLNQTADRVKYLCNGNMTKPFLPNEYIFEKVLCDYEKKCQIAKSQNKQKPLIVESLMNWILHMTHSEKQDKNFVDENKFRRTAEQIWQSKKMTGCTDYAILFATFARQLGIPTTFLQTAEMGWLEKLKFGKNGNTNFGHAFCECYLAGKWILVDPSCGKFEMEYNPQKIELSYTVGGCNIFVPYYRGGDFGEKKTVEENNQIMNDMCKDL